ncbi:phage tail assembly chaperone family protein, TAC [Pseudomonas ovata]|uniref:phage tail assembly chaperone family protein, TAC n=1 Tax=Pseudomonas ovata TaxID=1839709 RepID=UPI000D68AC01|nr:phage tail assembly chaperone family protein, TAC [Pseudomonas ovata]
MNLEQLMAKGGVISNALVAKKVEWTHMDASGKEVTDKFTVHVRRHAFGVMEAMFAGGEAERFKNARYLSASIMLGKEGDEELPYDAAVNLDSGLGVALLTAVNEVNNPPAKKKSVRSTKSSTNSSLTA